MIRRAAYQKVAIVHLPVSTLLSIDPTLSSSSGVSNSSLLTHLTAGADYALHEVPVHLFKTSQRGVLVKDLERFTQGPLELIVTSQGQVLFYRPPSRTHAEGMAHSYPSHPFMTLSSSSPTASCASSQTTNNAFDQSRHSLGVENSINTTRQIQPGDLVLQHPLSSAVQPDARFILVPERSSTASYHQQQQQRQYASAPSSSHGRNRMSFDFSATDTRGRARMGAQLGSIASSSSSSSSSDDDDDEPYRDASTFVLRRSAHSCAPFSTTASSTIVEESIVKGKEETEEEGIWIVVRAGNQRHQICQQMKFSRQPHGQDLARQQQLADAVCDNMVAMQQQQQERHKGGQEESPSSHDNGTSALAAHRRLDHPQHLHGSTTSTLATATATTIIHASHVPSPILPHPRAMTTPSSSEVVFVSVPPPPYTLPSSSSMGLYHQSHHSSDIPDMLEPSSEQRRPQPRLICQQPGHQASHHRLPSVDTEGSVPHVSRNVIRPQGSNAGAEQGEHHCRYARRHRRGFSESYSNHSAAAATVGVHHDNSLNTAVDPAAWNSRLDEQYRSSSSIDGASQQSISPYQQQQQQQQQQPMNTALDDSTLARDELISLARAVLDTLSSTNSAGASAAVTSTYTPENPESPQLQQHSQKEQQQQQRQQPDDAFTLNNDALARLHGLVSRAATVIGKYEQNQQQQQLHRRMSISSGSLREQVDKYTVPASAPLPAMISPDITPVTSPVLNAFVSSDSNHQHQQQGMGSIRPHSVAAFPSIHDNTNFDQLPLSPPSTPPMSSSSAASTWSPLPAAADTFTTPLLTSDNVKKSRRKSLLSGMSPSSLFQRFANSNRSFGSRSSSRSPRSVPIATMTTSEVEQLNFSEQDSGHNAQVYLDDDSENGGFDDEEDDEDDSSSSSDDDTDEHEEDDEDNSDTDDEVAVRGPPSQAQVAHEQEQERLERARSQIRRRRTEAVVSFDLNHHEAPPPSYESATNHGSNMMAMTPSRYMRSYSTSSMTVSPSMLPPRRRLPLMIQLLIQFESFILDSFKTPEFLAPCTSNNDNNIVVAAPTPSSSSTSSLASLSSAFKRTKSFSSRKKPAPKKPVAIQNMPTNRDVWLKRQPETISSFALWLIELVQSGLLPQAMSMPWRSRRSSCASPPPSPLTTSPPLSPSRPLHRRPRSATAFSLGGLQYETEDSWLQRTSNSLSEMDLAYAMLALEQHCVYGLDTARWSRNSSHGSGDSAPPPRVAWRQALQSLIPIV